MEYLVDMPLDNIRLVHGILQIFHDQGKDIVEVRHVDLKNPVNRLVIEGHVVKKAQVAVNINQINTQVFQGIVQSMVLLAVHGLSPLTSF